MSEVQLTVLPTTWAHFDVEHNIISKSPQHYYCGERNRKRESFVQLQSMLGSVFVSVCLPRLYSAAIIFLGDLFCSARSAIVGHSPTQRIEKRYFTSFVELLTPAHHHHHLIHHTRIIEHHAIVIVR